jgi:hypothetical protein
MPTNDFVPVATAGGANVLSQSAYLSSSALTAGQQPGIASSAFNNKALRQATYIASCLAQFCVDVTGNGALDDGNQSEIISLMMLAFKTPPNLITKTGSGTYTPSANITYAKVTVLGGGGGGGGNNGTVGGGGGGTGGTTTFGSISCSGGLGGAAASLGGAGGTSSGSGFGPTSSAGGAGSTAAAGVSLIGGTGGAGVFGGAGSGGNYVSAGQAGAPGSGSGGGGGGSNTTGQNAGSGGGAGGFIIAFIPYSSLSGGVSFSVGSGGTAGAGSTNNGGAGGSGIILIEEYYQ